MLSLFRGVMCGVRGVSSEFRKIRGLRCSLSGWFSFIGLGVSWR